MAVATKHIWTDYAILTSSSGDRTWKVQVNEENAFRCSCPSFIFSRVSPRSCKHTRKCEEQRIKEQATALPSVGSSQAPPRYMAEASAIVGEMLVALPKAPVKVTAPQQQAMVAVLMKKLAEFVPLPPVVTAPVAVGVRHITFDD